MKRTRFVIVFLLLLFLLLSACTPQVSSTPPDPEIEKARACAEDINQNLKGLGYLRILGPALSDKGYYFCETAMDTYASGGNYLYYPKHYDLTQYIADYVATPPIPGQVNNPVNALWNAVYNDAATVSFFSENVWPDAKDTEAFITKIVTNDPNASVYGLSVGASRSDVENVMKETGFSANERKSFSPYFIKDRIEIYFAYDGEGCVRYWMIAASTTDKTGLGDEIHY